MDVEGTLLAKAITTGDIAEVISRGIEPQHFADEEAADVYEFICDFFISHKTVPSMGVVKDEFPNFKPKLSKDPLGYHINRFVKEVKRRKAVELVRGYHEFIDDGNAVEEIEVYALEMARELTEVVPASQASRLSEGKKRKEDYYRRKREGIEEGIRLGIPSFDDITLGLQPHELLIWGGPPGGGKTTGLQHTALSAYLKNRTVLFISLEVDEAQIMRKFEVMLADTRIRYRALKALELNPDEEAVWDEIIERAEKERMEHDVIVMDNIKNCTVDKVAAEALRYKPDLICVDYLEEMRSMRGIERWQGVEDNGRALKQFARVNKIPVATATQLNRQGETSYQSAQKIADMLIVLEVDDELEAKAERKLSMRKYRDGPSRKEAFMRWNPELGEIHEKNFAERFPERTNKSLMTKQRDMEQRVELATIIGGRDNPFTKRSNGNRARKPLVARKAA